jgi:hypothetical protein
LSLMPLEVCGELAHGVLLVWNMLGSARQAAELLASLLPCSVAASQQEACNFSQLAERPTSMQALRPALERKYTASPPDLTRYKM